MLKQFVTKKCELYSQKTLTYTFGAVHDLNCTANPTERQPTLKKWYVLGESYDCVKLKQEDPSLPCEFTSSVCTFAHIVKFSNFFDILHSSSTYKISCVTWQDIKSFELV